MYWFQHQQVHENDHDEFPAAGDTNAMWIAKEEQRGRNTGVEEEIDPAQLSAWWDGDQWEEDQSFDPSDLLSRWWDGKVGFF